MTSTNIKKCHKLSSCKFNNKLFAKQSNHQNWVQKKMLLELTQCSFFLSYTYAHIAQKND